jgi:glycosyltransferase involved in cell wall biosynthesis
MRIAYFADAPRAGGAERYLADVAAGVSDAGHEVVVLAPQADVREFLVGAAPKARVVAAGSDVYAGAPSMARRAAALLTAAPALVRALAHEKPDLLHVNNGGYPGSDLCRLALPLAAAARISPRVMTVHSAPWPREHSDARVQAVVDGSVWRTAHAVVGATEVVREGLVGMRGMPAGLYRKVPYGVRAPEGTEQAAELRARLAPGGELLVGMVSGTADEEKGHVVLIDALARSGDSARAVIVGADPGAGFAEHVRNLGLEDRVAVAGRVPEVGPYLHAVDALVVPSTAYESLPLTVLEAMGAGRAVIASRLSGIPEAVTHGDTGWLFEPGDVDGLTAVLLKADADRDALRRAGARGRARWEERFSLAAMTASLLSLYDSLARVPPRC